MRRGRAPPARARPSRTLIKSSPVVSFLFLQLPKTHCIIAIWGDNVKKKQLLISLLPILGSFFYSLYLFLMEREKFPKAFLATLAGMGCFIAVYGGFAAICNATALDLIAYEWLLYLMFALSGIIWNIVYFGLFNKLSR